MRWRHWPQPARKPSDTDVYADVVDAWSCHHGFLEIIARAKATGQLRADFASEDLVLLLMANAGVVSATAQDAPDSWRRLVGQVLRGFADPNAPIPSMPPAPSSDDLYRAMARAARRNARG